MAISVPSKSEQYTNYSASPQTFVPSSDWGSKMRVSYAKLTFTAAGFTTADAGDISLIRMPAGHVRIFTDLCRVSCPIGTATSDLDIGTGAYTDKGTAVAADNNRFADSLDVGAAAIDQTLPLPAANGVVSFYSDNGFDIVCSFDTANSPAAGDLEITIVYQVGN